jgi:hypothetical protein
VVCALCKANAAGMSESGTKRTCRGRLTISAPEGKTDVPREPGHFRFLPQSRRRARRAVADIAGEECYWLTALSTPCQI